MRWCVAALLLSAQSAQASCSQALVMGLDVSGSVDATEYRLQRDGLAAALTSDAVRAVLLAEDSAPVDLAVYEWSSPGHQVIVQNWVTITDAPALARVADTLRSTPRIPGQLTTAIGPAMLFGAGLLEQRTECWKRTLDISGDGPANTGPRPQDLPDAAIPAGVIVNALVIGDADRFGRDERAADIKELSSYFRAYVIRGPDAFVETALGFDDYAAAMERKLLRELQSLALSATPVDQQITGGLQ